MITFLSRVNAWGEALLAGLKRRSWWAWLSAATILYVLVEVIRARVTDASTLILIWLFRGIAWLTRQPMGIGGLAIALVVAVLLAASWWQTRPRKVPRNPTPTPIGDQEKGLVQDIRTIWNRFGRIAVSQARDILRDAIYNLENRTYWSHLLDVVVANVDESMETLEKALSSDSPAGIEQVRDRFNAAYGRYLACVRWIATLESHGDLDAGQRTLPRLGQWKDSHFEFWDRLRDLVEVPEHSQTLTIFLSHVDNEAYFRLIDSAQSRSRARRLDDSGKQMEPPTA